LGSENLFWVFSAVADGAAERTWTGFHAQSAV